MRLFFIVAVKEPNEENFRRILEPSLKPEWLKNTILVYQGDSIFEKYNKGIDILIRNFGLRDDDAVAYIHSDVQIKDDYFEEKIKIVFESKPDVGLLGVYGSTHIDQSGLWWSYKRDEFARGNLLQRYPNKEIYTMSDRKGYFDDVVTIDGLLMIERGSIAKMKLFDSETYNFYHMYDVDHSLRVLENTPYKIAVVDILVFHDSPGATSNVDKLYEAMEQFKTKWLSKGYTFPLTIESFRKDSNGNL